MTKLLIDEYPLIVLPTLARIVGLGEAIVLQQIHYWLNLFQKANDRKHFRNGKWWVYNSLDEWQRNFPFWSVQTVRRYLENLREEFTPKDRRRGAHIEKDIRLPRKPLLVTEQRYNARGYDRTFWYTIDYEELERLEEAFADTEVEPETADSPSEFQQAHLLVPTDGSVEHEQMDLLVPTDGFVGTNRPIPETTIDYTETTQREDPPPKNGGEPLSSQPETLVSEQDVRDLAFLLETDNPQSYHNNPGPIRLAARIQAADYLEAITDGNDGASWTVPAEAGGADSFADGPLEAFCALVGCSLAALRNDGKRHGQWVTELRKLAGECGIDAVGMTHCLQAMPNSQFHWKTYSKPYQDSFKDDFFILAGRYLQGEPLTEDRKGRDQMSAFRKILAEEGVTI